MLAIQLGERISDIEGLSTEATNLLDRFSNSFNKVAFGVGHSPMTPDFRIFLDILDSVKVINERLYAYSKYFRDNEFEIIITGNHDIGYINSNNEWEKFYGMGKEHITILRSKIASISK